MIQIVTLYIHRPFSLRLPLTFDPDLQNIGKVATNIFGTDSSSWTVWYVTTLIYNEDKSEVYVFLFESIRNENNAFVDVCYIIIWTLYLLYNRVYPPETYSFVLQYRLTSVTCFVYNKRLVISY